MNILILPGTMFYVPYFRKCSLESSCALAFFAPGRVFTIKFSLIYCYLCILQNVETSTLEEFCVQKATLQHNFSEPSMS